ncbi:MAG: phosphatidate cytidylyltransferase [Clostridia bacterium]|nr:phosphatidate cytidylyltransferase [Clostridia bacterium]
MSIFKGNDNIIKRTLTGIVIVALIVGFLYLRENVDKKLFDIFLWGMAVIGTFELHRAFGKRTTRTQKSLAIIYAATIFPVALFVEKQYTVVVAVGLAFVLIIISTLIINHLTGLPGFRQGKDIDESVTMEGVGLTILTLFYPSIFLFLLHYLSVEGHSVALILAFVVSPCTDVAAYLVGSIVKGKKLCPIISPNKTISGAIGGFFGGVAGSIAVYFITGYHMWNVFADVAFFAAVGIVCAFLTEFGDLVESQIKRKLGVKDMGKLLPGHGGVMDRIDGLLFASAGLFLFFGVFAPTAAGLPPL